MLNFFKLKPFYFRIYKNKIEVKDVESGEIISRNSPIEFSSERLLLANFEIAEQFFRTVIKEFTGDKVFIRSLKIVLQPMELSEDGLTSVEKRAFRDSAEFIGAKRVVIMNHTNYLSDKQFDDVFNDISLY